MRRFVSFIKDKTYKIYPNQLDAYDDLNSLILNNWFEELNNLEKNSANNLEKIKQINRKYEGYVSELEQSYNDFINNKTNYFGFNFYKVKEIVLRRY